MAQRIKEEHPNWSDQDIFQVKYINTGIKIYIDDH